MQTSNQFFFCLNVYRLFLLAHHIFMSQSRVQLMQPFLRPNNILSTYFNIFYYLFMTFYDRPKNSHEKESDREREITLLRRVNRATFIIIHIKMSSMPMIGRAREKGQDEKHNNCTRDKWAQFFPSSCWLRLEEKVDFENNEIVLPNGHQWRKKRDAAQFNLMVASTLFLYVSQFFKWHPSRARAKSGKLKIIQITQFVELVQFVFRYKVLCDFQKAKEEK